MILAMVLVVFYPVSSLFAAYIPPVNPPFPEVTLTAGEIKTWEYPVSYTAVYPKMDIMYLIDTTGSMTSTLSTIADALDQFTDDLYSSGAVDINTGVVGYGDLIADGTSWYTTQLAMGDHSLTTVQDAIRNLPSTYGGDSPEDKHAFLLDVLKKHPALREEFVPIYMKANAFYDNPPAGIDAIDWRTFFAILYKYDYDGYLAIEPHSSTWQGEKGDKGIRYTIQYIRDLMLSSI